MVPLLYRKATEAEAVVAFPTTCPLLLIARAWLDGPPNVPRSVTEYSTAEAFLATSTPRTGMSRKIVFLMVMPHLLLPGMFTHHRKARRDRRKAQPGDGYPAASWPQPRQRHSASPQYSRQEPQRDFRRKLVSQILTAKNSIFYGGHCSLACHHQPLRIHSPPLNGVAEKFNWYPVAPSYCVGVVGSRIPFLSRTLRKFKHFQLPLPSWNGFEQS